MSEYRKCDYCGASVRSNDTVPGWLFVSQEGDQGQGKRMQNWDFCSWRCLDYFSDVYPPASDG